MRQSPPMLQGAACSANEPMSHSVQAGVIRAPVSLTHLICCCADMLQQLPCKQGATTPSWVLTAHLRSMRAVPPASIQLDGVGASTTTPGASGHSRHTH
jgi:hypothetical protein